MPTLLVVHHTPSPATQAMLEAVREGAADPEIEGVDVVVRPALGATVSDLLAADGVVPGTPANLGCMSGALKHSSGGCFCGLGMPVARPPLRRRAATSIVRNRDARLRQRADPIAWSDRP